MKLAENRPLIVMIGWYLAIWTVTAFHPIDRHAWALENLLVLFFVAVLGFTYRRFAFSNLSYLLLTIFLTLHAIGAHYTYQQTPIGFWLKDAFSLSRNHYDRLIHCAFGLLLVFPVREVLIRFARVHGAWAFSLPVCVIFAVSALFEICEAVVAEIVSPGKGIDWLGAQGDEWDAQWDMAVTLVGASVTMSIAAILTKLRGAAPSKRPSH
jgi:putative membrane protein